jgi:hypothetical protein
VIPGHHRSVRELRADPIEVEDAGLAFGCEAVCGYESTFAGAMP